MALGALLVDRGFGVRLSVVASPPVGAVVDVLVAADLPFVLG